MMQAHLFGAKEFLEKLHRMTGDISPEVHQGMLRSLIKLQRRVKDKLSDDVLHVRTGTLRRSINYAITSEGGGTITGIVGTNVRYAAVHEYGVNKIVDVRSFVRVVRGQGHTSKSGKWIKGKATGSTTVKAHKRKMELPERSFLRTSLAEMMPDFKEEMRQAVRKAAGIK